jgi:hypothetical protein
MINKVKSNWFTAVRPFVFTAVAAADGQTADGRLSLKNGAGQFGNVR